MIAGEEGGNNNTVRLNFWWQRGRARDTYGLREMGLGYLPRVDMGESERGASMNTAIGPVWRRKA